MKALRQVTSFQVSDVVVVCAALFVAGYAVWVASPVYSDLMDQWVSSFGLILIHLLAGVFGIILLLQPFLDHRLRRGWFFLTLAAFSNVIAEVIWLYLESIQQVEPFPSIADLFYLLYYPLTLMGVLLLPFAPMRRRDQTLLWLDLGIIVLAGGMLFGYFLIGPISDLKVTASSLERIVALSYPVGDLMLFVGLASLFQRDLNRIGRGVLFLLMGSMVTLTFADVSFAYLELHENHSTPPVLNVLWLGAAMLLLGATAQQLAAAKWSPKINTTAPPRPMNLVRLLLPYVAAGIGPVLLLVALNQNVGLQKSIRGLLFGTVAAVTLVLLRQYLVLIENVQLFQQMQKLAMVDSLTGVYNRHSFNERFQEEVARVYQNNRPLSLLLMDVDDFKKINDTYGHLQGDLVLQTIAQALSRNLRKMDVLARFGGDEFVVLLPNLKLSEAEQVAARLEQAVSTQGIAGHPFRISMGLVEYKKGQSSQAMLEKADQALYSQKAIKKGQQAYPKAGQPDL